MIRRECDQVESVALPRGCASGFARFIAIASWSAAVPCRFWACQRAGKRQGTSALPQRRREGKSTETLSISTSAESSVINPSSAESPDASFDPFLSRWQFEFFDPPPPVPRAPVVGDHKDHERGGIIVALRSVRPESRCATAAWYFPMRRFRLTRTMPRMLSMAVLRIFTRS